jgi:hypothetical protein
MVAVRGALPRMLGKNLFSLRIICCSLCRLMQRIVP